MYCNVGYTFRNLFLIVIIDGRSRNGSPMIPFLLRSFEISRDNRASAIVFFFSSEITHYQYHISFKGVAEKVLDNCVTVVESKSGKHDEIEFNYELIDDAFAEWMQKPSSEFRACDRCIVTSLYLA